jgi:hypothetical protein
MSTKKKNGNIMNSSVRTQGQGIGPLKSAPSATSRKMTTVQPKISRNSKSFRVAHRELVLASIPGSTAFSVQSVLALNPGLASTFPWLAPQAGQWEQYIVHALRAIYVPLAPTSTQGTLTISPDYDASDPTPTTEVQLSDNFDTVEDSCWQDIVCVLDVAAMMASGPRKYVRPCAIAGDIKTFDIGKIFVASNNETGTSAIGKLWLEYDFEFFVPQNSPSPDTFPQQTSLFNQAAAITFTTATPKAITWDTVAFDPLNFGPSSTFGIFQPPAGTYRVDGVVTVTDSASEAFLAVVEIWKNGASLTPIARVQFNEQAGIGTGTTVPLPFFGIVPMNGTDTLQIEVTLTGAAGILRNITNDCALLISLA